MGATQPLPEGFQSIPAFAVADEHDRAGEQVEDDGQVAVALADVDFIDGDLLELMQLGLAEFPLEMRGLNLLDGVPADQQNGRRHPGWSCVATVPGHSVRTNGCSASCVAKLILT